MDMEVQELSNEFGVKYTHIIKGHTYIIIEFVKSKHPDTGKWYDAILYKQLENGKYFVRSKESFINNFKRL